MHSAPFPARRARALYRHELRVLSYVTLDEANGGMVRNLSAQGVSVQAVAALHAKQRVRVRFELRSPRLRVDEPGEVAWSEPSGQCGIRFVDPPARTRFHIQQWIFGNLLEAVSREADYNAPTLKPAALSAAAGVAGDGLIVSAAPRPAIQLEPATAPVDAPLFLLPRRETQREAASPEVLSSVEVSRNDGERLKDLALHASPQVDWLFRPLSAPMLAFLIDSLAMIAAFLLFACVFLGITHELPAWPLGLEAAFGAAIFVPAFYCGLTYLLGGATPGVRLAHLAGYADEGGHDKIRKSDEEEISNQESAEEKTAGEVRLR
jgi:hypothetical protein